MEIKRTPQSYKERPKITAPVAVAAHTALPPTPTTMSQLWDYLRDMRDDPYVLRPHYWIHPTTNANAIISTKSGRWSAVVVFDQRDHFANPAGWMNTAYGVELGRPMCAYPDGLSYLQAMFYGYEIMEVKNYATI